MDQMGKNQEFPADVSHLLRTLYFSTLCVWKQTLLVSIVFLFKSVDGFLNRNINTMILHTPSMGLIS